MLKKTNKTMRDRYFWIAAAPLYTQSVAQQKKTTTTRSACTCQLVVASETLIDCVLGNAIVKHHKLT